MTNCFCNICGVPMYSANKPVDGSNFCSATCRSISLVPAVKGGMKDRWKDAIKHGKEYAAKSSGVRPVSDCVNWPKINPGTGPRSSRRVLRVRGIKHKRVTTKPQATR